MSSKPLDKALRKAIQGSRNRTGLWLACQLRDSRYSETEAEPVMIEYASRVHGNGTHPYTRAEAIATLKIAFGRPARGKGMGGDSNNGKPCQPVNGMPKQLRNRVDTPKTNGVNSVNGLTLAALAEAKLLPAAFLKSLGVSDFKLSGLPVVRIPYAPKWPHAQRDVRLATVLGHLLGVKGPDRQGWYRAPVASTKVTERRGFQTRYKTILERLRMSDLSRRKPAKELGIGYATLKGLIDSQNRIQAKDTGA